jgi:hypothetical protein
MVCCSANPRLLRRHFCRRFSPSSPDSVARLHAAFHLNFRSLFQSQRHEFDKSHCIGKSLRSARQVCARRTHEASRSEHDLNLAILYAVQSGFRYSASLFLPDLRCRPLGELCSGCSRQRGALIQGRFRGPQASRFWPIFQVLFYSSRLFAGACNPDLQSRPAIQACNVARHSARTFSAIKARGTPLRSGCGAIGASPAAAINAATGST